MCPKRCILYALFYEVDINANVPPKSAHIVSYNLSPKVGDSVAEKYLKILVSDSEPFSDPKCFKRFPTQSTLFREDKKFE